MKSLVPVLLAAVFCAAACRVTTTEVDDPEPTVDAPPHAQPTPPTTPNKSTVSTAPTATPIVVDCTDGDGGGSGRLTWTGTALTGSFSLTNPGLSIDFQNAPIRAVAQTDDHLNVVIGARLTPTSSDETRLSLSAAGTVNIEALAFRSCATKPMKEMIAKLATAQTTPPPAGSCSATTTNAACIACCKPRPDYVLVGQRQTQCRCASDCADACGGSCTGSLPGVSTACFSCVYGSGGDSCEHLYQECKDDPECAAAEQCLENADCLYKE